ncbi:hypothetical protein [Rivihabitans pingtungensis]|uniref:Uncharacterized protein n=1 Tax=Rivihabitans pingtungensis TaxID=1054498 RepID=A0A318KWF8_9NEIS|nr:hypothetical protein [Rivihabitans pingtungensis]PXX82160.1 hypothetical protein DFR34_101395 [Rivihabitans pingtungensis]
MPPSTTLKVISSPACQTFDTLLQETRAAQKRNGWDDQKICNNLFYMTSEANLRAAVELAGARDALERARDAYKSENIAGYRGPVEILFDVDDNLNLPERLARFVRDTPGNTVNPPDENAIISSLERALSAPAKETTFQTLSCPACATFDQVLSDRLAFNDKGLARDVPRVSRDWGMPQFRDKIRFLLVNSSCYASVCQQEAGAHLGWAWYAYQSNGEDEPASPEQYEQARGPVESLFNTQSGACLSARLAAFVRATDKFLPRADNDVMVSRMSSSTLLQQATLPADLVALDSICQQLWPLWSSMPRQTGNSDWEIWFREQSTLPDSKTTNFFQTLAEYALAAVMAKGINKGLDAAAGQSVGLIDYSVLGFSGKAVTFGSNVLAPWTATYAFSKLVKKQGPLFSAREQVRNTLKSDTDSDLEKLETCLNACLDSIDWTAAKAVFGVTPFGLLTTVYSGAKWFARTVGFIKNSYHGQACTLLDLAELGRDGQSELTANQQLARQLAQVVILHLCNEDQKRFLKLMTASKETFAYGDLVKLIDG